MKTVRNVWVGITSVDVAVNKVNNIDMHTLNTNILNTKSKLE